MSDSSVIATLDGRTGHLLLNRPRTLNALDHGMVEALSEYLTAWRDDPAIHAVVIEGAGERAFCAGGDIRAVRDAALAGDAALIERFFAEEYQLNQLIAGYPKPYVALIDGFCMGGGVGISVHGAFRVTTEAGVFAMPETAIALFPDVGGSYVLPRLPGALGMYLGLTGARLTGADAVHAGLATHFVRRVALPSLRVDLARDGVAVIAAYADALPPFSLAPQRAAIDRCFGQDSVPGIIAALQDEGTEWARETLAVLARMSPASLIWSHRIIRDGAGRTLPQCLAAELALTREVTRHPDFAEGVRAMVIDKDRAPKWADAPLVGM
jgi:enoyl-CoA hydratase